MESFASRFSQPIDFRGVQVVWMEYFSAKYSLQRLYKTSGGFPSWPCAVWHANPYHANAILASASVSAATVRKSKPIPENMAAETASRGG